MCNWNANPRFKFKFQTPMICTTKVPTQQTHKLMQSKSYKQRHLLSKSTWANFSPLNKAELPLNQRHLETRKGVQKQMESSITKQNEEKSQKSKMQPIRYQLKGYQINEWAICYTKHKDHDTSTKQAKYTQMNTRVYKGYTHNT